MSTRRADREEALATILALTAVELFVVREFVDGLVQDAGEAGPALQALAAQIAAIGAQCDRAAGLGERMGVADFEGWALSPAARKAMAQLRGSAP